EVVQGAAPPAVTWARPAAARARACAIVARAAFLQWCRQVLNPGEAFGRVGDVFARSPTRPSGAAMPEKAQRDRAKKARDDQLPCYRVRNAGFSGFVAEVVRGGCFWDGFPLVWPPDPPGAW